MKKPMTDTPQHTPVFLAHALKRLNDLNEYEGNTIRERKKLKTMDTPHRRQTMSKAASRPKRPKQERLPGDVGADPKSIPAIEDCAEELSDARDERRKLIDVEKGLQEKLLGLFHEHGITVYVFDQKTVKIKGKEAISIKKNKEISADG